MWPNSLPLRYFVIPSLPFRTISSAPKGKTKCWLRHFNLNRQRKLNCVPWVFGSWWIPHVKETWNNETITRYSSLNFFCNASCGKNCRWKVTLRGNLLFLQVTKTFVDSVPRSRITYSRQPPLGSNGTMSPPRFQGGCFDPSGECTPRKEKKRVREGCCYMRWFIYRCSVVAARAGPYICKQQSLQTDTFSFL